MRIKIARARLLLLACLSLTAPCAQGAGLHNGEADKIEAQVSFLNPSGRTTTNSAGTTYQVPNWGWQYSEPKIYPSNYWGTFPLYFVGQTMNFNVTLKNTASQGNKGFKLRVQAVNNVLETNGSAGMQLAPPQEWVVDSLHPGETRILSGSVYIAPNPNLPSGLDVTKIRIFHLNEGNNQDAALIKEELAVWCPPNQGPPHP